MARHAPSRSDVLTVLRAHETELRQRGVESVTVFGSVPRGDAGAGSDVDLAIRPGAEFSADGFDHFSRIEALREHLAALLGRDIDLVEEPTRNPRLRRIIEQEGVRAF
jgi:hypothetical protein